MSSAPVCDHHDRSAHTGAPRRVGDVAFASTGTIMRHPDIVAAITMRCSLGDAYLRFASATRVFDVHPRGEAALVDRLIVDRYSQ